MWDQLSYKIDGGSVTATGSNATSYYLLLDLKRIVVNFSPTLGKSWMCPETHLFVYYTPGDRLETWDKPTEEEREGRKGQASKEVSQTMTFHGINPPITNLE